MLKCQVEHEKSFITPGLDFLLSVFAVKLVFKVGCLMLLLTLVTLTCILLPVNKKKIINVRDVHPSCFVSDPWFVWRHISWINMTDNLMEDMHGFR